MRCLTMIAAGCVLSTASAFAAVPVKGDYVEVRTASVYAGPCHYNGEVVTTGRDAILAWNIASGSHDNVNLAGVRAVAIVSSDAVSLSSSSNRRAASIA